MIVGRSRYKTYSLDIFGKKRPSKVNTQEIQEVKKKNSSKNHKSCENW